MFNQYTYQQKLKFLLWSIMPVLLLCYLLAIKKTTNEYKAYKKNEELVHQSLYVKQNISALKDKETALASWSKQYLLDSTTLDAGIISALSINSKNLNLNLKEYKPLSVNNQNVWTRIVTVEGDYHNILKLIYSLEQQDRLCRVGSVNFRLEKFNPNTEGVLNCSIYIQNIIQK